MQRYSHVDIFIKVMNVLATSRVLTQKGSFMSLQTHKLFGKDLRGPRKYILVGD